MSLIDKHFWLILVLLAVVGIFLELGRMDVCTANEGQRATPPAEMVRSGNWVVPTINNVPYLAKPPLLYWAIAVVYTVTGNVSALTARIPSALCAVALVLSVYLVLRKRLGEYAARWASIGLLGSPYFLEHARWAQLDVPLALATFMAITATWTAFDTTSLTKKTYLTFLGGLALGAAILLKGPAPLAVFGSAWAAYLITKKEVSKRHIKTLGVVVFTSLLIEYVLRLSGLLTFPVALLATAVYVVVWAWITAPAERGRVTLVTLGVVILGVLLATPWALAVLNAVGWDNIRNLLHSEVVTRTHSASDINSGTPFYYLIALPVLVAPWGFLFPFHFSRSQWRENSSAYRFCVVTAWMSILVFSLIAGKEYEYILPAFPLLLGATGVNLARITRGDSVQCLQHYIAIWTRISLPLLGFLALGMLVYAVITNPHPLLLVETALLASIVIGTGCWALLRGTGYRPHSIALQAILLILIGLLVTRSYHYTGRNSPKEIAETTGSLLRNGYAVEAGWVRHPFTPAFAFYAATPIAMQMNFDIVQQRFSQSTPYYYLVQKEDMDKGRIPLKSYHVLMGPYGRKEYLLLGNAPLPGNFSPGRRQARDK